MSRRFGTVVAGVIALGTAGLVSAPAAAAVDSSTLACGSSPAVVRATEGVGGVRTITVTVRNGCSTRKYVRVDVTGGGDSPCASYLPGQSRTYTYQWPADLQRITYCTPWPPPR